MGAWSKKEVEKLIACIQAHGEGPSDVLSHILVSWSRIAGRLPRRTDNEIKNHWESTHIKTKLLSRGIDPQSRRTIQPFHSDGSSRRDDRSPSQEIQMVVFSQTERCIVTGNFDLAASNGEREDKDER
ncbi:hypothetical protein SUGI_0540150 [Cryptomeria japonica]|nr:hypothetical protein SUGI_0540150 [Cryptomeria japonica]